MQYKKDEIKERIDRAALAVFAEKGYRGTRISDIGKRAGVSVGNIYRYYSNKEEIFYENVNEQFIEEAKSLLIKKIAATEKYSTSEQGGEKEFWLANEEVISFMLANRNKMIIVFGRSEGTKYEKVKKELVEFILAEAGKSMGRQFADNEAENPEGYAAAIIYESLIGMMLCILEKSDRVGMVRKCLSAVNTYHMFGITGFFKSE